MADGRWQMADGRWQMADGRWQMADGRQYYVENYTEQQQLDVITFTKSEQKISIYF